LENQSVHHASGRCGKSQKQGNSLPSWLTSGISRAPLLGTRRFGRAKYKNCNRHGNPDAHAKTCPDSNANADVGHRCADNCTQ